MKNVKVLIVEDDPMVSFLHRELLKKYKISNEPLGFVNGKEAYDFMVSQECSYHYLVLLDLNMPVMNGWEFLDKLEEKEVASRTKVAIVTSSIDKKDREKAETYETVDSYLFKPLLDFSPVRRVLGDLEKGKELQKRA